MARKPEAEPHNPEHPHHHDHGKEEVCGSPGPWFSFSLTAGLAAVVALVAYVVWRIL